MYQWWDSNFDWCLLHIHHAVHCIVLEDWPWQQTTSISQDDHQKTTVFAIGVARTFIIILQLRKLRIPGKTKSKYHLIVLFHHTGVFIQCLSSQQCFSQLRSCNPALNALSCRLLDIDRWLSVWMVFSFTDKLVSEIMSSLGAFCGSSPLCSYRWYR